MKLYSLSFLILITEFCFACKEQNEIQLEQNETTLNIDELGSYDKPGNILISTTFDECGEWGGHSEKIKIYTDSNRTAYAKYVVYPFKCDSSEYYYNIKNLKPKFDTTIVLNKQKQKAITAYISRLAQAKMAERFPGNAGQTFSASKPDSSLVIRVYDSNQKNDDSYKQLLSELF
ncbi:MAG: hypothetical protein ACRYFZ_20145 [Janthinobacterium lividum]